VFKFLGRVLFLAALGAAVGYMVRRLRKRDEPAIEEAGEPEGTWGLERSGLAADPNGGR